MSSSGVSEATDCLGLGKHVGTHHRLSALPCVSNTGHCRRQQAKLEGAWSDPVPPIVRILVGFGDPGAVFLTDRFTDDCTGPLPGQVPLRTVFPL